MLHTHDGIDFIMSTLMLCNQLQRQLHITNNTFNKQCGLVKQIITTPNNYLNSCINTIQCHTFATLLQHQKPGHNPLRIRGRGMSTYYMYI